MRTKLIIFLGTPHRGSQSAGWAKLATNLANIAFVDTNKEILKGLEVNSEVLENIHEEFKEIVHDGDIKIHSFFEGRALTGVRGISGKL